MTQKLLALSPKKTVAQLCGYVMTQTAMKLSLTMLTLWVLPVDFNIFRNISANDKFIQTNEDKTFVEKSGFDDVQIYGDNNEDTIHKWRISRLLVAKEVKNP